jgi:phytoene synthase
MHNRQLQAGFREAKTITKKFAKTFYLASFFLPPAKKYASYSIYALCRLSDAAVDDLTGLPPEDSLGKLQQKISQAYTQESINEPLLAAFRYTVNTYRIPQEYFLRLLEGMRMDLAQKRFADFNALYEYCYRAAGVVGLMMLKVFGPVDEAASGYAVKLGVAMQLTNILRDIKEDLGRNRIYLPQDELKNFKITEQQLFSGKNNENFRDLMRFQIKRAQQFYDECLPGIKLISCPRTRLVILAMAENYRQILKAIEKNNFDVFRKRAGISNLAKLKTVFKILLNGSYR